MFTSRNLTVTTADSRNFTCKSVSTEYKESLWLSMLKGGVLALFIGILIFVYTLEDPWDKMTEPWLMKRLAFILLIGALLGLWVGSLSYTEHFACSPKNSRPLFDETNVYE